VIEAFPADQLFSFSVGGMRTFGALANEMLGMAVPTVQGIISDDWSQYAEGAAISKDDILAQWDATTARVDELFPTIPAARFQTTMTAFGQWTMPGHDLLLYIVDNENPPSRARLRVPSRAGNRAATVLGAVTATP
jgi:hypothetical protein